MTARARTVRGGLIAAAALVAATLALAAPAARAASIVHAPGAPTIGFTAAPAEVNDVTVTREADAWAFSDPGARLEPSGDCVAVATTVRCPAAGVTTIQLDLGDGDDTANLAAMTIAALVFGRSGEDRLTGGQGPDILVGGTGRDRSAGGPGNDRLTGEDVQNAPTTSGDVLDGGPGADELYGAAGPDELHGGDGDDPELRGFVGDDLVDGGAGADTLSGGDGNDALRGGEGDDVLGLDARIGAEGIPSERGDDALFGEGGDDLLRPGLGPTAGAGDADALNGGAGRDRVTYERRPDGITASIDAAANDGAVDERDNVGQDVERLVGSAGDDSLAGGPAADELDGGPGSDSLDGGDGADTLDGGSADAGNDALHGGGGADTLLGNAGNDVLEGGDDADTVMGGGDADRATGGSGEDDVTGGAGADTVSGGPGDDAVDGAAPVMLGIDGNDVVAGDAGNDRLSGAEGNDEITGGAGVDDMSGGAGADMVDYGFAGAGVTVTLDGRPNDGAAGEGDNVRTDVEDVGGGGREDTLTGSADANVLDGGSGEDYLDGAARPDELRGGRGQDVIRARDRSADRVQCGIGAGADFAIVDRADRVSGCERADTGRGQPTAGVDVVLQPSGATAFGLPGMERTVPLQDRVAVPVATTVDVRSGRVALTSTRGRRGRQRAIFYAGIFTVRQRRARAAVTELRLKGGDFRVCRARTLRGRAIASQARRRRTVRRLSGNGSGRFRTRGRFSAATVRGTQWLVEDRCDGTLTRAVRGTVRVDDFGRGRTITLRAGQSYLARATRATIRRP